MNSAGMGPAHLSVIGVLFLLESVVWYAVLVHCPEFRSCPLFRSSKCIGSVGIAVRASTWSVIWRRLLLGGSVIEGSTVHSKYCCRSPNDH